MSISWLKMNPWGHRWRVDSSTKTHRESFFNGLNHYLNGLRHFLVIIIIDWVMFLVDRVITLMMLANEGNTLSEQVARGIVKIVFSWQNLSICLPDFLLSRHDARLLSMMQR